MFFTKKELLEVISAIQKIFPKLNMSEELLTEVMKVKILFFGGSAETWTPADFTNAQNKVHILRSLAEHFLSYYDVYLFKWKPQDLTEAQAKDYFQAAELNLQETAANLGGLMESPYNLQDIEKLVNEFDKLFPPVADQPSATERIRKYLPLVMNLKQIVLGDQSTVIPKEKWKDLLLSTAEAYSCGLYAYYFLPQSSLFYSSGLHSFDQFMQKTTSFFTKLMQKRASDAQIIQYSEFDRLLQAFYDADFWLKGLKVQTAQSLLHVLFERILIAPEKRLANFRPDGFSLEAVALLQSEYNLWSANQHVLESIYQTPQQEYTTENILAALATQQKKEPSQGIEELINVFTSPIAMSIREKDLLEIKDQSSSYQLRSASMMNLARVISRTILRSYAMDISRIQTLTGVSLSEVEQAFQDFRPLLVELELIEPDNMGFPRNRFYEANLFTPTADGNEFMNFREGAHLVIMLLSGIELNKLITVEIKRTCAVKKVGESHFGDRVLSSCAAQVYFLHRKDFFASMPSMQKAVAALAENDFKQMFFELLKATGWKSNPEGDVKLADLGLVPPIFQYEEMLMQRFDADKSGTLVDAEADVAYPIYGPLINLVSPTKVKMINRTAFFSLIKNGSIPKSFNEILGLLKDVIRHEVFHKPLGIKTDRAMLAKVFSSIADAVRSSGQKKPKPLETPEENKLGVEVDGNLYRWDTMSEME